jgi:hypothetical protein
MRGSADCLLLLVRQRQQTADRELSDRKSEIGTLDS